MPPPQQKLCLVGYELLFEITRETLPETNQSPSLLPVKCSSARQSRRTIKKSPWLPECMTPSPGAARVGGGARQGTALKHSHKNTQTNLARYRLMAMFGGGRGAAEGRAEIARFNLAVLERDTYAVFRHFTLPSISLLCGPAAPRPRSAPGPCPDNRINPCYRYRYRCVLPVPHVLHTSPLSLSALWDRLHSGH